MGQPEPDNGSVRGGGVRHPREEKWKTTESETRCLFHLSSASLRVDGEERGDDDGRATMSRTPGTIVLFGSGETSPDGQRVHERVMREVAPPVRAAVLETPAGFELNSAAVAGRLADFLKIRLQNYHPSVEVIPARRRGTTESPDNPEVVAPIGRANYLMLGPGSPTYAVRQLTQSLAWNLVLARQRLGHPLVLASAAAISVGASSLPVYEIYKVGEDPHWKPGLDLFGPYGARLAIVPHWNNAEGGEGLDTSHCFLGDARFTQLRTQLPDETTIVGIDEHTALVVDFGEEVLRVMGAGTATLIRGESVRRIEARDTAPLGSLGITRWPEVGEGLPPDVVEQAGGGDESVSEPNPTAPDDVLALAQERADARSRRDWATADRLRAEIGARGWQVQDEPSGYQVLPIKNA